MQPRKIFALALMISVLASTVGIARVSHFCKTSKAASCEMTCHPANNNPEKCCDDPGVVLNEGNDCCQSIIKLYQQKLITLVTDLEFKFVPLEKNIPSGQVLLPSEFSAEKFNSVWYFSHGFPLGNSGKSINLLYGKFLI